MMAALTTKKTLFYVMIIIATVTTLFLVLMNWHPSSNYVIPPEMRKMHNFNMLSKTLTTSHKTPQREIQTQEIFRANEQVLFSHPSPNNLFESTSTPPSQIDKLSDIFKRKMSKVALDKKEMKPVCQKPDEIANSCDNNQCLRMKFPTELRERIRQIVEPEKLQVSPQLEKILDSMARNVKGGSEVMMLSGTSSNHFLETQALIRNLHENIYPHFKNFTFVLYNLGLTVEERRQVASFCKCQVVDFPFDRFPKFVSRRLCYAWKPVIVRAHINQANTVMWVDASIRFDSDPTRFSDLLKRTKRRTMQIAYSRAVSPFRTYRSMYHYFGDEPCMYLNMGQVQSGIDLFTNDLFVKKAVLDPWAACAVTQTCMCPLDKPIKSCADAHKMTEAWLSNRGPIVYGLCHRYDQSSLSIILHKLYQDTFRWVAFDVYRFVDIRRKDTYPYFESFA